jgi:hypothetical protein
MAVRTNNLSLEQLDELIVKLDGNIESMKQLRILEQQMTLNTRADMRLSAIVHSLEEQRASYHTARTRQTINGLRA